MRHALWQVTGSNVVSVAEDEVMRMLILIRNFLPGYKQVCRCVQMLLQQAQPSPRTVAQYKDDLTIRDGELTIMVSGTLSGNQRRVERRGSRPKSLGYTGMCLFLTSILAQPL